MYKVTHKQARNTQTGVCIFTQEQERSNSGDQGYIGCQMLVLLQGPILWVRTVEPGQGVRGME